MLLMIDNYDSFTYNLVQYFAQLGVEVMVRRNDAVEISEIDKMNPRWIVISPGPGTPDDAGVSIDIINKMAGRVPILGVCLGHQAIGQVFGGRVIRAERLMHGKTSYVHHDGKTIFKSIPTPYEATRYHSLIVDKTSIPACLEVSAWTSENEIMGLRHREMPVEGVQFHPESILTEHGHSLLRNFLELGTAFN